MAAMPEPISRRQVLAGGVAAGTLAVLGLPEWLLPALAQGETLVPFTDIPANFATNPSAVSASRTSRSTGSSPIGRPLPSFTENRGAVPMPSTWPRASSCQKSAPVA